MIPALIQRELRTASRQRSNHWLRVGAAAAVFFTLFFVWSNGLVGSVATGRSLFRGLNIVLVAVVWFVAPVMTADCLSREKRDGTLPLLFLTSLRPFQLVVAKSALHFIRAGMVLLAAFPVLAVPLMMGGLTWLDVARVLVLHLASLGLALSAGLMASAVCRRSLASRALAALFMLLFGMAFLSMHFGARVLLQLSAQPGRVPMATWARQFVFEWSWFLKRTFGPGTLWQDFSIGSTGATVLAMAAAVLAGSIVLCSVAIVLASAAVARDWRDVPSVRSQGRLAAWLSQPLPWMKRWWHRRRKLAGRNPVAWLQTGTRTARLAQLGWCAGACAAFSLMVPGGHAMATLVLGTALVLVMALTAVGSFHRELESGALELLLVTPLTPVQIVRGRWWALMWFLMPAAVSVAALCALYGAVLGYWNGSWLGGAAVFAFVLFAETVALASMALVGIAFSLSGFPFAGALFMALVLVVGLPMPLLLTALGHGQSRGGWDMGAGVVFLVFQAFNLWRSWIFACRQLALRRFLHDRTQAIATEESSLATAEATP